MVPWGPWEDCSCLPQRPPLTFIWATLAFLAHSRDDPGVAVKGRRRGGTVFGVVSGDTTHPFTSY